MKMGESVLLHQRCLALKLERDQLPLACLPPGHQSHTHKHSQPIHKARIRARPRPPLRNQCPFDVTTPASSSSDSDTSTPTNGLPPTWSRDTSPVSTTNYFNGYQDGYLLFLAWQAANSVCVWDRELMMAVQECEYVGHLVGGVLLVGGHPHILATLTHAWSRALLAAPIGFTMIMLGEISDCTVVSVPQGQFTPLADALCWVIYRLTKDGGCAEADAVQTFLTTAFPNLNAPDPAHVHTTLSNLIRQCKVYYSGRSYGIVQPHTYQLTAKPNTLPSTSFTLSPTASSTSHLLMDVGKDCGGADFICEGGISHAAVQTNLAELITGASQPSDILITPKPSGTCCEGSSAMERQLSMRALSAARTASLRLSPTRATLLATAFASVSPSISSYTTNTYRAHNMSDVTVRGERGSVLSKLLRVSPRRRLGCFSAQFPPPEWSDKAAPAVHLHCLATQTSCHNKQEENESWWSTTLRWTSRSATLPRRMRRPHSVTSPVSQIDLSPAQLHMSYPHIQGPSFPYHSYAQPKASTSHYLHIPAKGGSDQFLAESSYVNCNLEPVTSSRNKRHQSPVRQNIENHKHQSPVHQNIENHKHQSPDHQNTENYKHQSQVHQHIENDKHQSSFHNTTENKRSHNEYPLKFSPSRQEVDNLATTRNRLNQHPPHHIEPNFQKNATKAAAQTVKRQSLSQCRKSEKEFREMLGKAYVNTSGELHIKKSGQIVVRKLREEQEKKTDNCTQRPRETALSQQHKQRLHHNSKGQNQKQQESCQRTQILDKHQRNDKDCQDNKDRVVDYGDKKMQKNHVKSNKHNSFVNKEEKNQKMRDTEESEKEQLFDTSQRDENLENNENLNENCQLEVLKRSLQRKSDSNSRNYDRSSLQLDLGVTHMNNSRKVMSSPQRLEGLKNNMLHDGNALTDISKGSSHNLTSRNLCYQEVDKCHKELCSQTLDQVQQQSVSQVQQPHGTSISKQECPSSFLKKTSLGTNNQDDDNVIVIDDKQTILKDESCSVEDMDKVSGSQDTEGMSVSTYPSLSELNLNFSSLAAQKILCGASINSIDTLVEVNLAAERCHINKKHSEPVTSTDFGFV